MNLILLLMAFCVGMAMSVQAAVNTQLAASIGANSVVAALVSFGCGTIVLAGVALSRGGLGPSFVALASQPAWKFAGGFLGAAFVFGTVFLAPRIGLLSLIVLVIAGQLITSMAIDHFGLVNMAVRKVSGVRVAGACVVALGVAITLFGDRIVAAMSR
ncbi:DMT family transporter [Massilia sp. IC2-477]|uniref:DMT family transporter n=1 Tax=unclassified Massilia TaxID=2609279 RepID=UPI001D10CC34|nr:MULTISPECIES: DMT family transporter [unclassified Massilia]MCC2956350.1 DMT family transporter [Massilia sp. IC2-477]MCC2972281.1 DMT family transporter [Massilia sp. IC2-476]